MALRLFGLACLALALRPASAVVYTVTNPKDGPGHCNQDNMCNIRGAWGAANGGDTIVLDANISMVDPLIRSGTTNPIQGNLTISAKANAKVTISAGGPDFSFILIEQDQLEGALVLEGFTITGFSSKYGGAAIHIFSASSSSPGQGPEANTVLVMKQMMVFGNSAKSTSGAAQGGAIAVYGKGSGPGMQANVVFIDSHFENNVVEGSPSFGSVMYGVDTHLTAIGCHFGKNTASLSVSKQVPNSGGVINLVGGDFHMNGGGFGKNTGIPIVDSGVVIVGAGASGTGNFGDVFITGGVKMMKNTIPPVGGGSKVKQAAMIVCNHLHVNDTTIDTLDFAGTSLITLTADDQYFSNCALTGSTKVDGFGMYIRNLKQGSRTLTAESGYFANCTSGKPWLPCPQGSECINVRNNQGLIVAYDCFATSKA